MATFTSLKHLLLMTVCLVVSACSSSSSQKLVRMEFGDTILFQTPKGMAVPLDFGSVELTQKFDVSAQNNSAYGKLQARVKESGKPYFLCDCAVSSISVNGLAIGFDRLKDPDHQNTLIVLDHFYSFGDELMIEVNYSINISEFSFQNGGVGLVSSMSDLQDGNFFEQFGPTNFEFDQYKLIWQLDVVNSPSAHRLFTNGAAAYSESTSSRSWKITFPDYFTSSSPFVHLTNRTDLSMRNFTIALKEKVIPVTVYGASSSLVDQATAALPQYFHELENDYGPYAHNSFVAYMSSSGGGMEYVGATITSFGALDHELTHSWFARGVMPSDGRSGWIDEAVASWRDYGYKRASSFNTRAPTNLANFSPFERFTPRNCYRDGRALFAELDLAFADQGGFKKVLGEFFAEYKQKTVTTQEFVDFVEQRSPVNLRPLFTKNIYGDFMVPQDLPLGAETPLEVEIDSMHPSPLTQEEISDLR